MEADEFLKFIKHSEYRIVEQLHKLPAKISLLALMLNSESHRKAVLKILKQAYVPHNSSVDKIDRVDAPFCPDYLFRILTFVGLWARLCQGSSLGLEPISLCCLFILSSL